MLLVIGNKNYSSWSLRPWLAFKQFQIPFEEKVIFLDQPNTTTEISKFSPSLKVPCLMIDDQSVWDSLSIMEYINESFPEKKMWPKDTMKRALARSYASEMHSGFQALRTNLPMKVKERFPGFDYKVAQVDIDRISQMWTEVLTKFKGPYLFGEFSIADCMFAPVVFRIQTYGVKVSPTCEAYVQTMLENPYMMEWEQAATAEKIVMDRYEATKA